MYVVVSVLLVTMSCFSLPQVDDVLRRAEVREENHVCSDGGRSSRPPLVSLTSDPSDLYSSYTTPCYSKCLICFILMSSSLYPLVILILMSHVIYVVYHHLFILVV